MGAVTLPCDGPAYQRALCLLLLRGLGLRRLGRWAAPAAQRGYWRSAQHHLAQHHARHVVDFLLRHRIGNAVMDIDSRRARVPLESSSNAPHDAGLDGIV
jgi:hypothetical protein